MKRLTGKKYKVDFSKRNRPNLHWQEGGWAVESEDGKYFFVYITSEMASRLIKEEISESEFESAKRGEITLKEMLRKYGGGHA
ncbi:hypothetical protein [Microbulbifer epialgicus]|uniref:Uncharacterized protein n=1 Tax=Microbulbifer epialgicus TaxID=393907 RepID=A0ABV4P7G9_9GAMM